MFWLGASFYLHCFKFGLYAFLERNVSRKWQGKQVGHLLNSYHCGTGSICITVSCAAAKSIGRHGRVPRVGWVGWVLYLQHQSLLRAHFERLDPRAMEVVKLHFWNSLLEYRTEQSSRNEQSHWDQSVIAKWGLEKDPLVVNLRPWLRKLRIGAFSCSLFHHKNWIHEHYNSIRNILRKRKQSKAKWKGEKRRQESIGVFSFFFFT